MATVTRSTPVARGRKGGRLELATQVSGILAGLILSIGLYMAWIWAPRERVMGDVQRIFYYHVPSNWVTYLSVAVGFVASVGYLWKRREGWDRVARASAEIGAVFGILGLVSGALWGKAVWGTYWTWDARLTTTLLLWLLLVGYLILRQAVPGERGARFGAVLLILAALDVPIIHMSVVWWRTLHPKPVVITPERGGLHPAMLQTLLVCLTGFTFLYVYFLLQRVRITGLEEAVERWKERVR